MQQTLVKAICLICANGNATLKLLWGRVLRI